MTEYNEAKRTRKSAAHRQREERMRVMFQWFQSNGLLNRPSNIGHELLAIGLFPTLAFSFLWRALSSQLAVFGLDFFEYVYGPMAYVVFTYREGHLPLWNPYAASGYPFFSASLQPIFYPLNLLLLIHPLHFAFTLAYSAHLSLAGLFTYFYGRLLGLRRAAALFGGTAYMLNTHLVLKIYAAHFTYVWAYAWLPLAFVAAEKTLRHTSWKWAVGLGAVLALQVTLAVYQIVFLEILVLGLYFAIVGLASHSTRWELGLSRKLITLGNLWLVALGTGLGLAAFMLLPVWEMASLSPRSDGLPYEVATQYSMSLPNLATFVFPNFLGQEVGGDYWGPPFSHEMGTYVGLLPLLFALFSTLRLRSRYVLYFACVTILSIILALGSNTPVYRLALEWLPGLDLFRVPPRALIFSAFAISILGGHGADFMIRSLTQRVPLFGQRSWAVWLLILVAWIGTLGLWGATYPVTGYLHRIFQWLLFTIAGLAGGLAGPADQTALAEHLLQGLQSGLPMFWAIPTLTLGILWASQRRKSLRIFEMGALAILISDLWATNTQFIIPINPQPYLDSIEAIAAIFKAEAEPYRLYSSTTAFSTDTPMIFRLDDIQSEAGGIPDQYWQFLNPRLALADGPVNAAFTRALVQQEPNPRILDMLNVKYILTEVPLELPETILVAEMAGISRPLLSGNPQAREFPDRRVRVYRNSNYLPRAYLVHSYRVLRGDKEILSALISSTFAPSEEGILEQSVPLDMSAPPAEARGRDMVQWLKSEAMEIEIDVTTNANGLLILADTYYPGWQVYVDGKRDILYRANHVLRAVALSSGHHRVRFVYRPASLTIGILITGGVALAIMAAYWIEQRKTRVSRIAGPPPSTP